MDVVELTEPVLTGATVLDWGGHVRGVDVMQLRDGRVAEKLSYVKG
jgi:hypothetical protein